MISQSINIPRRGSGKVELNFTVPFPCRYKKEAVHIDDIDYESCPLRIELAIPKTTPGVCESRLAGQSECGIEINPSELDSNIFMNIRHQDSSDYKLTNAQVERKLYLKTYQFDISKAWTDIILPVINVRSTCNFIFCYNILNDIIRKIIYFKSSIRFILTKMKTDGKGKVVMHIVIHT